MSLNKQQAALLKTFRSNWKFKVFKLSKLPLAWITGLKIISLSPTTSAIGVKYGYWTKNPFSSLYFAVQLMAAELSTGVLGFLHKTGKSHQISMLVTECEATFLKKGTGKIQFVCQDGEKLENAIQTAIETQESQTVKVLSIGLNEEGVEIGKYWFTWSFKAK